MAKILTATQVKKLKFEGSGKLKAYSIDSTCALYLVCFANGSRYYKLRTKRRRATKAETQRCLLRVAGY